MSLIESEHYQVMLDALREAGPEKAGEAMEACAAILRLYPAGAILMLAEVKIASSWFGGARHDAVCMQGRGNDTELCKLGRQSDGGFRPWNFITRHEFGTAENAADAMAQLDRILRDDGWAFTPQVCAGCNQHGFPPWLPRADYPVLELINPEPRFSTSTFYRFVCRDCRFKVSEGDKLQAAQLAEDQLKKKAARDKLVFDRARERHGTPDPINEPAAEAEAEAEAEALCDHSACPNPGHLAACPYQEEVYGQTRDCNCCPQHRRECRDDI